MFERFTPGARDIVANAQQHARRLGHRYIGCEHLLLAAVSAGEPASAVLREHGVTPERVEEQIVMQIGLGQGSAVSGLDQEALASIGIDLDAVRARIEASFGAGSLAWADQAARGRQRRAPAGFLAGARRSLRRRRCGQGTAAGARRAAGGGQSAEPERVAGPYQVAAGPQKATGRYRAAVPAEGHLPFTPRAKKSLQVSVREAQARRDAEIGVLHLAVALVTMRDGMVPAILSALGASGPSLSAAVLDRYRQAS